jgi:hypothetical protein
MTGDHQIECRATAALASDGPAEIGELDLILTDTVAAAVSVHVELLRVNRRLAAVLDGGGRELETVDRARELAGRRSELRLRWEHLDGLVRKLRARRDRLAAG